ncbi:MAG: hypothetical protein HYY18_11570 [Planctomycetes bacterium]|nr:hypothetical protein [Planctomycetota bacterium]
MKSYAAAADLFEKEESAFESGLALERQGDLAAEAADWPLARARYELALGRYGDDVDDYTAGCLASLARALEALGDRDRARTCLERAIKAYRGMEDERSARACEADLERLAKGKKKRD